MQLANATTVLHNTKIAYKCFLSSFSYVDRLPKGFTPPPTLFFVLLSHRMWQYIFRYISISKDMHIWITDQVPGERSNSDGVTV